MITEGGYLHENPVVEAILSRSGITALDEVKLLQNMDIALSQPPDARVDNFSQGRILTGLESIDVDSFSAKSDPRRLLLLAALEKQGAETDEATEAGG